MNENLKSALLYLVAACLVCVCLYGAYWIAKNMSYWLFYEDMVKQTISESVK